MQHSEDFLQWQMADSQIQSIFRTSNTYFQLRPSEALANQSRRLKSRRLCYLRKSGCSGTECLPSCLLALCDFSIMTCINRYLLHGLVALKNSNTASKGTQRVQCPQMNTRFLHSGLCSFRMRLLDWTSCGIKPTSRNWDRLVPSIPSDIQDIRLPKSLGVPWNVVHHHRKVRANAMYGNGLLLEAPPANAAFVFTNPVTIKIFIGAAFPGARGV